MKAGGDLSSCVRMCSTKGRWVAAPCEMSVLKADLRRTGGTGHSGNEGEIVDFLPDWMVKHNVHLQDIEAHNSR